MYVRKPTGLGITFDPGMSIKVKGKLYKTIIEPLVMYIDLNL